MDDMLELDMEKPTMDIGEAIRQASMIIAEASSVVAFTGAGISVESGIPDFRSQDGLWSKYDPDEYCNAEAFKVKPQLFWTMAKDMQTLMDSSKPNPAHYAIAELEKMGLIKCVITQNIDNLHQEAGSKKVYELHGNSSTASCRVCKLRVPASEAFVQLKSPEKEVPLCSKCSGVLKLDVVLFGELLTGSVLDDALRAAMRADVMLVVGTSLTVSPANYMVTLCKSNQGKIIVCDPAGRLPVADVMLCGKAGQVLPELLKACKKMAA